MGSEQTEPSIAETSAPDPIIETAQGSELTQVPTIENNAVMIEPTKATVPEPTRDFSPGTIKVSALELEPETKIPNVVTSHKSLEKDTEILDEGISGGVAGLRDVLEGSNKIREA